MQLLVFITLSLIAIFFFFKMSLCIIIFFFLGENYILCGSSSDLHSQQTAQLVDEQVKGPGSDHLTITASHPTSNRLHNCLYSSSNDHEERSEIHCIVPYIIRTLLQLWTVLLSLCISNQAIVNFSFFVNLIQLKTISFCLSS